MVGRDTALDEVLKVTCGVDCAGSATITEDRIVSALTPFRVAGLGDGGASEEEREDGEECGKHGGGGEIDGVLNEKVQW